MEAIMERLDNGNLPALNPAESCAHWVNGKKIYGDGTCPRNQWEPCTCPNAYPETDSGDGSTIWTCGKLGMHCWQPTYEWEGHNARPCSCAEVSGYYCEPCLQEGRLEHLFSPAPDARPAHFFCRHGHYECGVEKPEEELKDNLEIGIESAWSGVKDELLALPKDKLAERLPELARERDEKLAAIAGKFLCCRMEAEQAKDYLASVHERLEKLADLCQDDAACAVACAGDEAKYTAEKLEAILSNVETLRQTLGRLAEDFGSRSQRS